MYLLTQECECEPGEPADSAPHLPAQLGRGHCVHREPEQRHQELTHCQIHQQQVKITPQLKKDLLIIELIIEQRLLA